MNESGLYLIGDISGFTPQISRLVSMINYARHTTLSAVADLKVDQFDYLHDPQSNSIGALVLHIAAAEVGSTPPFGGSFRAKGGDRNGLDKHRAQNRLLVCCMTALSVAALGQSQAVAPERALFGAFYDKVTKAEPSYSRKTWRLFHSNNRRGGTPWPPLSHLMSPNLKGPTCHVHTAPA
jgi:hypothetical protein